VTRHPRHQRQDQLVRLGSASVLGGLIGRRLSPLLLRAFIVVVGTAALIKFLVS
jgi:hypothetical protein